jgi:hypothetical protein
MGHKRVKGEKGKNEKADEQPKDIPQGGNHLMGFWKNLASLLPQIRTQLQVTGLIAVVGGFIATHALAPDQILIQIAGGAIGVLFLFFGQWFRSLKDYPEEKRVRLTLWLFALFIAFILALVLLIVLLLPKPPGHAGEIEAPLPSHLELVDVSFLEEGEYAKPKIDVKVRNTGPGVAFITEAKFHVEKKWSFKPFTKKAGAYYSGMNVAC